MLRIYESENFDFAHKMNKMVRNIASNQAKNKGIDLKYRIQFNELYKRSLLFDAPYDFDAYLLYIEFNREPKKKFYVPRRKVLRVVVQDLQDLYDRKIKMLAISLPPRVGKSTLGLFFVSWIMGKNPESTSAMAGHSKTLTDGFYKEILGIIENDEYLWKDVFPNAFIGKKSMENTTIDINKDSRFPTLTCRSAEGTWTGGIDCKMLLYCDDLIKDLEEALNPSRLDSKFDLYANVMKDRTGDNVIELHVATRWSTRDPIGRLKEMYEGDPRYRFRVIPALNEKGESNFDYPYGVGFSTAYYKDIKRTIDDATWSAKYMGDPYVREGLLFDKGSLDFYNGILPEGECTKYFACDVAWGGGDSLAGIFGYKYGDTVYIPDVIYNQGDKDVTRPIVAARLLYHKPNASYFEANNGGHMYSEDIDELLKKCGCRLYITNGDKPSTNNKFFRILTYAPDIKKFKFLCEEKQSAEYKAFMKELTICQQNGKVKHDDAPDCASMLAEFIVIGSGSYEVGNRIF